jgi:ribonuclease P protein component
VSGLPGQFRYRRHQRLTTHEIEALLRSGRRRRAAVLSIQTLPNGLACARLALIVPKRHVRRAVDRNRVKRLLREWFRINQRVLVGGDFLIRVNGPVTRFDALVQEVDQLLRNADTPPDSRAGPNPGRPG